MGKRGDQTKERGVEGQVNSTLTGKVSSVRVQKGDKKKVTFPKPAVFFKI